MIKVVKRCEFPMPDGFKCNRAYTVSSATAGTRKFCEEHIGNDKKNAKAYSENAIVNSTNTHAQVANDIAMREWVISKIKSEKQDENRIKKLESEINRLNNIIVKSEGNQKKIESVVNKVIKTDAFTSKVEGIVVSATRKTQQRVSKKLDDLEEKIEIVENKNKNGDEEE